MNAVKNMIGRHLSDLLLFLCLFCVSSLLGARVWAHNIEFDFVKGGIGISFFYSDGTPLSFGEVKVFSPSDKENAFQIGSTDKNGCFVFLPDEKGKWRIEVNDGMGHGLVKEIEVTEDLLVKGGGRSTFSLWQKLLIGLSIIIGFTGILFYITAKREVRRYAHSGRIS